MHVVREVGNPSRLPEHEQSIVLSNLGNRLEPMREQLVTINAEWIFDQLMEDNRRFMELEAELRTSRVEQKQNPAPSSVTQARRRIDPKYRSIIAAINGFANIPAMRENWKDVILVLRT